MCIQQGDFLMTGEFMVHCTNMYSSSPLCFCIYIYIYTSNTQTKVPLSLKLK